MSLLTNNILFRLQLRSFSILLNEIQKKTKKVLCIPVILTFIIIISIICIYILESIGLLDSKVNSDLRLNKTFASIKLSSTSKKDINLVKRNINIVKSTVLKNNMKEYENILLNSVMESQFNEEF